MIDLTMPTIAAAPVAGALNLGADGSATYEFDLPGWGWHDRVVSSVEEERIAEGVELLARTYITGHGLKCAFSKPEAPGGMGSAHRLNFDRLDEPLGGIQPDRLQHGVAGVKAGGVGAHQRARDEGTQLGQHRRGLVIEADGRGRLQAPPAAEHREPPQEALLSWREQRVAPIDGQPEGLMARRLGRGRAGEEREPIVEALEDLVRREEAHAAGGLPRRRPDGDPARVGMVAV